MIKRFRELFTGIFLLIGLAVSGQTTNSSPYSRYGLGTLRGPMLPQSRSMGSLKAGLRRIGNYNNINVANPASYSDIVLTTFDIGGYGAITSLGSNSLSQKNTFNAALSHIAFAIPVGKKSALSFGLLPYSDRGYRYRMTGMIDTNTVDHVYAGDGGLSKGYLGYGFKVGKHFSVGANMSYLFGRLEESSSSEFNSVTFANSRTARTTSIGGLNYDYGIQYTANLSRKTQLVIGYSASTSNKLDAESKIVTTRFFRDLQTGEELPAMDSTYFVENPKSKLTLPSMQSLGFSIDHAGKWMIGADYSMGKWSDYRLGDTNPGLKDSYAIGVGGQFTPDLTSVNNYLKLIDYRFGLRYEKTFINTNGVDVKDRALSFGLGLPLPSERGVSFYKVNFSTELGQMGTYDNGLVRERYARFYIGVTLNDRWFQKFKFD